MADDIVERLRTGENEGVDGWWFVMAEAADEIEQLRRDIKVAIMGDSAELKDVKRENEKLREALKPFADAVLKDEYSWKYDINSDDFRAAAAAIRESGDE